MSSINHTYQQGLMPPLRPAPPVEKSCCEKIMALFCCCFGDSEPAQAPLLATRVTHEPSSMQRASHLPASQVVPPETPSRSGPPGTPIRGAPLSSPEHSPEPSPMRTPPARLPNPRPMSRAGSLGRDSSATSTPSHDPQYGVGGYKAGHESSADRDPFYGVE